MNFQSGPGPILHPVEQERPVSLVVAFDAFVLVQRQPLILGQGVMTLVAPNALPVRIGLNLSSRLVRTPRHDRAVLAMTVDAFAL